MGLEFRRNGDGSLIKIWWGRYRLNGDRRCIKLCGMNGHPPTSWRPEISKWSINDRGDEAFESSRLDAERMLTAKIEDAKRLQPMSAEAAINQMLADKFGDYKVAKVKDLESVFDQSDTVTIRGEKKETRYMRWGRAIIPSFVNWWISTKHRGSDPVINVTKEDAAAFVETLSDFQSDGKKRCADTINRRIKTLRSVFKKALPPGMTNPFEDIFVVRADGDEVIHREPLTSIEDIDLLLNTARKTDTLTYYLATVGIYTALRKGDICELRWENINLTEQWTDDQGHTHYGTIDRVLNKTKVRVHIPMFPPLKNLMDQIFTERKGNSPYVFPEAARLYAQSRKSRRDMTDDELEQETHIGNDTLTENLKYVYALAFSVRFGLNVTDSEDELLNLKEILQVVRKKVIDIGLNADRQNRIMRELDLYASGNTFTEIARELSVNKSQIHYDLTMAEKLVAPKRFIRSRQNLGKSKKKLIQAVTNKQRRIGAHAASIYDFHALRTTFVTIARSAGMSLEDIRLFTGHTDTKMLEHFYDRTRGISVAKMFTKAAPKFFRPKENIIDVTNQIDALQGTVVPAIAKTSDKTAIQNFAKSLSLEKRMEIIKALVDAGS